MQAPGCNPLALHHAWLMQGASCPIDICKQRATADISHVHACCFSGCLSVDERAHPVLHACMGAHAMVVPISAAVTPLLRASQLWRCQYRSFASSTLEMDAARASVTDDGTAPTDTSTSGSSVDSRPAFSYGARKVARLGGQRGTGAAAAFSGTVHVYNTNNNIFLTLTDPGGSVKAWTSAGTVGFKNARKSLPVAAEKAAEELARKALKLGYGTVTVKLKGVGKNKQYAVQSLHASGLKLTRLMDITPIPYNGCRRPKRRRV